MAGASLCVAGEVCPQDAESSLRVLSQRKSALQAETDKEHIEIVVRDGTTGGRRVFGEPTMSADGKSVTLRSRSGKVTRVELDQIDHVLTPSEVAKQLESRYPGAGVLADDRDLEALAEYDRTVEEIRQTDPAKALRLERTAKKLLNNSECGVGQ